MDIYNEYIERKKKLDEVRFYMMNTLRKYGINSIEIFLVMKALYEHNDLTQTEVANLTDISAGTVANIVLNLAEKGWITNEKDENDFSKRKLKRKLLNLTPTGIEIVIACLTELGINQSK